MYTKAQVKQLLESRKQIDSILERARGMNTIFSGQVTIASITNVFNASTKLDGVVNKGDKFQDVAMLPMIMKRFKNEIICIIKGDGVKLPAHEKYIGISKCHKDDEFDLGVGCTIAQARAMAKVQNRRLQITEQILGGTINE